MHASWALLRLRLGRAGYTKGNWPRAHARGYIFLRRFAAGAWQGHMFGLKRSLRHPPCEQGFTKKVVCVADLTKKKRMFRRSGFIGSRAQPKCGVFCWWTRMTSDEITVSKAGINVSDGDAIDRSFTGACFGR